MESVSYIYCLFLWLFTNAISTAQAVKLCRVRYYRLIMNDELENTNMIQLGGKYYTRFSLNLVYQGN
jgi:hypothetical protein